QPLMPKMSAPSNTAPERSAPAKSERATNEVESKTVPAKVAPCMSRAPRHPWLKNAPVKSAFWSVPCGSAGTKSKIRLTFENRVPLKLAADARTLMNATSSNWASSNFVPENLVWLNVHFESLAPLKSAPLRSTTIDCGNAHSELAHN